MKSVYAVLVMLSMVALTGCGKSEGGGGDQGGQDIIIGDQGGTEEVVTTDQYDPGVPPDTGPEIPVTGCGNGKCEAGENSCTCPKDCGPCGGCCQDNQCVPGTANNACGKDGAACQDCTALGQTCQNQACTGLPGCGDGVCGQGENQCNCPADCGACQGCCQGGQCLPGTANNACGKGGGQCQDCSLTGLTCVNQTCITTTDEGSCKAFYFCVGDCPPLPQGQACVQECQSKLSPQGMQDVQNLQNCLQQYGCFDKPTDEEFSQCLEDYCIEPYFKCFSGNLYQDCAALIDCIVACPDDNPNTPNVNEQQECVSNCWTEATFEAQMDLENVIKCARKECAQQCTDPNSPACDQCWNQVMGPGGACEALWDKCVVYGTQGCYYLLTCLNSCPEGDQQCIQGCVDNTSKNGLALYNAIYDCIMQACPICQTDPTSPQCDTCFTQVQQQGGACYNALQTCLNDRTYGTKKCGELWTCVNACMDQKCVQDCLLSGTKTATQLWDAMITCALDKCPSCQTTPPGQDCDACFNQALQDQTKCKNQFDACMNDNSPQ